jgi:two-component system, chemotaxis family, protein-glutamate methylesterase/glutaminase
MTVTAPSTTIRVLVVADSSPRRAALSRILQRDGDIAVMAEAGTAIGAPGLVGRILPHVVILDLQLADGGGQDAIEQIMANTPTPILVLLAPVEDRSSRAAVEALDAGALDALPTPERWTLRLEAELRRTVRQLRKITVVRHPRGGRVPPVRRQPDPQSGGSAVVALAASTGGPSALATVLAGLHGLLAPVLVVQHLHADFTHGMIDWMSRASALPVSMAADGELAEPGRVYLAPGDSHLRLGLNRRLELASTPVSLHRPSADQLFESVAERAGRAGVGVLLTGMGEDGARGLLEMHRQGAHTFAQDEASSAVFGMPRAAQRLGAVADGDLLPLDRLAAAVLRAVSAVGR